VQLKAATKDLLIKAIFEYRLRNDIEQGDIERDIDRQYCTKYPDACEKEPSDYGRGGPSSPPGESMLSRVSRWAAYMVAKMPKGGWPFVSEAQAVARGTICSGCALNVAWRGGCVGCTKSTATILLQLKALKKTAIDGKVFGCLGCGQENSVAMWIQKESLGGLTAEQSARMPDFCWRRTGA
jgi:hypothetical protein